MHTKHVSVEGLGFLTETPEDLVKGWIDGSVPPDVHDLREIANALRTTPADLVGV